MPQYLADFGLTRDSAGLIEIFRQMTHDYKRNGTTTLPDISKKRLRRGVFASVQELVTAIDEYVAHHNTSPKPFIWTKSARDILQKVIRANNHFS